MIVIRLVIPIVCLSGKASGDIEMEKCIPSAPGALADQIWKSPPKIGTGPGPLESAGHGGLCVEASETYGYITSVNPDIQPIHGTVNLRPCNPKISRQYFSRLYEIKGDGISRFTTSIQVCCRKKYHSKNQLTIDLHSDHESFTLNYCIREYTHALIQTMLILM